MADRNPHERLADDGAVNIALPDEVTPRPDGGYSIETRTDTVCELCRINRYPFSQDEAVFYEDEDMYVVETADKKGHTVRNMAVVKEHGNIPAEQEKERYLSRLQATTAGHIRDGEMLVFGSMRTFGNHWHAIACDLEGDDLEQIHDVERYSVEHGSYSLENERIASDAGDLIL